MKWRSTVLHRGIDAASAEGASAASGSIQGESHALQVSFHGRGVKQSFALEALDVDVGAGVDEILEMRSRTTTLTSHHQRSKAVLPLQVNIGAVVDEQLDASEVTHGAGVMQRGVAVGVDEIDVRVGQLQQIDDFGGLA